MIKTIFASATLLCALALITSAQSPQPSQKSEELTKWISESLMEMETIKVGQTRAELLTIFTGEGGISTRLSRTYVYRKCPYIKVAVEFEAAEGSARDAKAQKSIEEDDRDVIRSISKPYLEWSIID